MRWAFDCVLNDCGEHLEAATDEELYRLGREHVEKVHPDVRISDEDLRAAMAPGIYDVQDQRA